MVLDLTKLFEGKCEKYVGIKIHYHIIIFIFYDLVVLFLSFPYKFFLMSLCPCSINVIFFSFYLIQSQSDSPVTKFKHNIKQPQNATKNRTCYLLKTEFLRILDVCYPTAMSQLNDRTTKIYILQIFNQILIRKIKILQAPCWAPYYFRRHKIFPNQKRYRKIFRTVFRL